MFVSKDKEKLIGDILREDYSIEEKTLRLLSLDAEKRNKEICDFSIDNSHGDAIDKIVKLTVGELQQNFWAT